MATSERLEKATERTGHRTAPSFLHNLLAYFDFFLKMEGSAPMCLGAT